MYQQPMNVAQQGAPMNVVPQAQMIPQGIPQPQVIQPQAPVQPPLKEGTGTVIASLPKVDAQTGVPKTGTNAKGPWALYKVQVQTQYGQPSFSFFQAQDKPAPTIGQIITYKYAERPNPNDETGTKPMKTMVFYNVTGQAPPQPVVQQQAQGIAQAIQPHVAVQNDPLVGFVQNYKQQTRASGNEPDMAHALGSYLIQFMSDKPTVQSFNTVWNSVQ